MLTLQILFLVVALVSSYFVFLRPILKSTPRYAEYYAAEENCLVALRAKYAGIKGKMATAVGMLVSAVVSLNDFFMPYVLQVNDWSSLTDKVPAWAIPVGAFALFALIGWFRKLAEKRDDAAG